MRGTWKLLPIEGEGIRICNTVQLPGPTEDPVSIEQQTRLWPAERLTRVPYWVYQDEDIYRREQEKIFRGNTWNFLGLEAELPNTVS